MSKDKSLKGGQPRYGGGSGVLCKRSLACILGMGILLIGLALPFAAQWYTSQPGAVSFGKQFTRMRGWIRQHDGMMHDGLQYKFFGGIRGMTTTVALAANDKLAEIPMKLCLALSIIQDYEKEEQSQSGSLGVATKIAALPDKKLFHTAFASALVAARARARVPGNSWAHKMEPYLSFLFDDPGTFDGMLQLESEERLKQLKPSIEGQAALQLRQFAEFDHPRVKNRLERSEIGDFSINDFLRASLAITSRNFITRNAHTLAPLIDLFNHEGNSNAKWSYDGERDRFIIWVVRPVSIGEQITVSYGNKSNAELLSMYGFTLPPREEACYSYRFSLVDDASPDKDPSHLGFTSSNKIEPFRFSTCKPGSATPFMSTWRENLKAWRKEVKARLDLYEEDADISSYRKSLNKRRKETKNKGIDWWKDIKESGTHWDINRRRMKIGEYITLLTHSEAMQLEAGTLQAKDALALSNYVWNALKGIEAIIPPASPSAKVIADGT